MKPAWQSALHCSVIGAAHQRQGKPCQDASMSCSLGSAQQQLQLLAVADGHGGSRYWLSDIGSREACRAARAAVEAALRQHPLKDQEQWLRLLQTELPEAIQQRWLDAVQRDWQQQPDAQGAPFSSAVYGCTLGLVLITTQWWGCTGIGDWDLVSLEPGGEACLRSQETLEGGAAEATTSLCQADAFSAWSERAQLQRFSAADAPAALVLSTDGIRKSCATDADFLQLSRELIALTSTTELERGLREITAQGSGDDVSVAIGIYQGATSARGRSALRRWLPPAVVLGLSAAGALGWWLWPRPPELSPLQRQVAELCQAPAQIDLSLSQRQGQFAQLLRQPTAAQALINEPERDPLGALIAATANGTSALEACTPLKQALNAHWQAARKTPLQPPRSPQTPAQP